MTELYQFAEGDGHADWSPGIAGFDAVWKETSDLLRFHRGDEFVIREKPEDPGPTRPLREVRDHLEPRIAAAPLDTVFVVRALSDDYAVVIRRHEVPAKGGALVLEHARAKIGTPYVLRGTDCSWLTMVCYGREGVDLDHHAASQHADRQVLPIERGQILPGDLLFHHEDAHVSLYLDAEGAGRVIDTEPHDTSAPWGGRLGVGVQIRPMNDGYYCDWANVNGIGRVVAINGAP